MTDAAAEKRSPFEKQGLHEFMLLALAPHPRLPSQMSLSPGRRAGRYLESLVIGPALPPGGERSKAPAWRVRLGRGLEGRAVNLVQLIHGKIPARTREHP